ncbi:hypothetical protein [Tistrella sp.]|nr:hypothetical protein [Tistrella sp.]
MKAMIRVQAAGLNAASVGMRRNFAGRAGGGMAVAAMFALALGACAEGPGAGTDPDIRAARAEFAAAPFPTLNSVPEKAPPVTPLAERAEIRQGLASDQARAGQAIAEAAAAAAAAASRPEAPRPGLSVGRIGFAPGSAAIDDAAAAELRAAWRIAAARDESLALVAGTDQGTALATARLEAASRRLAEMGAPATRIARIQAPAGSMAPDFEIFIAPTGGIR